MLRASSIPKKRVDAVAAAKVASAAAKLLSKEILENVF
jgi:hypothetical protein